jgi:Tfp pilus assembly protein PilV
VNGRRGAALLLVLIALFLMSSLSIVALTACNARLRLAADNRWATEAQLIADGALASISVERAADLAGLADHAAISFPRVVRGDGWSYLAVGARRGTLITLSATAERRAADGSLVATRRASLLLVRRAADTVRVLGRMARF